MTTAYEALHYRGDVSGAQGAVPGRLLGYDELFQPWEVLDAEQDPDTGVWTVNLQDAGHEALMREMLRLEEERTRTMVRYERLMRAGLIRTPEQEEARLRVVRQAERIREGRERRAAR